MKKDITNLFCFIDDFTNECEKALKNYALQTGQMTGKLIRSPGLTQERNNYNNIAVSAISMPKF